MNYLELFFGTFEKYSWIGSATNIVHLENTIVDSTVADLAKQLSMQIPLMKVIPYPPNYFSLCLCPSISFTLPFTVHLNSLSCLAIWCLDEISSLSYFEASLLDGGGHLVDAVDLRQ
jgi:hypothetical protein